MPRPTIRRTTREDVPALVRIHADMGEHYAALDPHLFRRPRVDGYAPVLEDEITDDPRVLQLVAQLDGEVVGALDARLEAPHEEAEFGLTRDLFVTRLKIEYLATAAAHRGSGIGTALVEAAEAWGREHGARVAELTTYQDSPLAYPFWTGRAGYAPRSVNLRKAL
jgi:GNAT superfamily N-acetyltransferase